MSQSTLEKISTPIADTEVLRQLNRHYGLQGVLTPIAGERDQNFVLTQEGGERLIVKLAHEDELFETLDLQSCVVALLQQNAPDIPVSTDILNYANVPISRVELSNGNARFMRVNAFMPGIGLNEVPRTTAMRQAIGRLTAGMALALKDFRHPAESRELLWDIQKAAALQPHVNALPDDVRGMAQQVLEHFLSQVLPLAAQLPHGVIHNDLNLHNLFVDPQDQSRIAGCIDFGDMVRAPLINDLAIAAAYQLDGQQPLLSLLDVAEAYHGIRPLQPLEIEHFSTLVAMRFVLTVAITHWRAQLHPANAPYILRNAAAARVGLLALQDISPVEAAELLYAQLGVNRSCKP